MKRICLLLLFMCAVGTPGSATAAVAVPAEVAVTADAGTITVSWRANADHTDGYHVYWGTTQTNLDHRRTAAGASSTTATIGNLQIDTVYFVAVSAYGRDLFGNTLEGVRSETVSVTTGRDEDDDPAIPRGFAPLPDSITKGSVSFVWEPATDDNITAYRIYYGIASGVYTRKTEDIADDASSRTVADLDKETRYYFVIRSVDATGRESADSAEWIVDTLFDGIPPDSPHSLQTDIVGRRQVRLTFDGNNDGMADLEGYLVHHGPTEDLTEPPIDIGPQTTYVMTDLVEDETVYFAISAYDRNGNRSEPSPMVSIAIEQFRALLMDNDDFDAGCFVSSSGKVLFRAGWFPALIGLLVPAIRRRHRVTGRLLVLTALLFLPAPLRAEEPSLHNTIGMKIGSYLPEEALQKDIYRDDAPAVSLFYDRRIFSSLYIDVEIGFMRQKGRLHTLSGKKTDMASRLLLIPVSSTLKWRVDFTDFIFAYVGAGPSMWYFREKTGETTYDAFDENKYGVGGYHGRVGLVYLTDEEEWYRRCGFLIEGTYNKVDRFDKNALNIGGWVLQAGYLYRF